ncbi:MAG TPA: YciI family protein [Opitutus sp.]|nr:YciI family protein [Opitutus sp.]
MPSSPYLLFFRDPPHEVYKAMSPEQRQQLLQQWNNWCDRLAAQGKVQQGHPLEPSGRLVSGPAGERVCDGPFAESKETIGGYFLLSVENLDEATAIAQGCPSLRYGMVVEVRPIAEACPVLGVRGRASSTAELATAPA